MCNSTFFYVPTQHFIKPLSAVRNPYIRFVVYQRNSNPSGQSPCVTYFDVYFSTIGASPAGVVK